jgi:hypothetical protein
VQLAEGIRPPFDGGEFATSALMVLRAHTLLLSRLGEQHTPAQ